MEGTVKWFNQAKGFGFLTGDDGQEYFVHHSQVSKGAFLKEQSRISFDVKDTEKGKQAQNVSLKQEAAAEDEVAAE
ncbi:cold shock domain-containing protein [Candidatus Woesearchaeota archaeon]|nr:cold shock domain-containing protein [Candidatus Woesearchaeota archaeon]